MSSDVPATYAIWVQGTVGPEWEDRLSGLRVYQVTAGTQQMTELVGDVIDQTALAGVLSVLFDLGLPIVSVDRLVELPSSQPQESGEQR